jgi:hypothetical protein
VGEVDGLVRVGDGTALRFVRDLPEGTEFMAALEGYGRF